MDSIKALCSTTRNDNGCWIGLKSFNGDISWDDGTYFDYASDYDVTGGTYPWASGEPLQQMPAEQCIFMNGFNDYLWSTADDVLESDKFFVCMKPNEFCYKNAWQIVDNLPSESIQFNGCTAQSNNHGVAVMTKKQWNNEDLPIKIEYTFKINNIPWSEYMDLGITMHHVNGTDLETFDGNLCEYTSYGIHFDRFGLVMPGKIERAKGSDNQVLLSDTIVIPGYTPFNITNDRYYTMGLILDKTAVGVGGLQVTLWISDSAEGLFNGSGIYQWDLGLVASYSDEIYFGVRNHNLDVSMKSLYISGNPKYVTGNAFTECIATDSPTFSMYFLYVFVYLFMFTSYVFV